jgi:anti-sigma-K factor RskA
MTTPTKIDRKITPADLEAKFEELQGDVNHQAEAARSTAAAIGAAVAVVVVVAVFLFGKRRGNKKTTLIEVRRL